jgi:hypothetical protein
MAAAMTAPAPAHAQATRGSFDRPPYYDGKRPPGSGPVAHLAPAFRDEPASLDPTPKSSPALAAALDSVRVELDRLGLTRPMGALEKPGGAPDVRFGVRRGGTGADGVPLAPTEIDTREPRRMTFEVTGPGRTWKEQVTRAAGDTVRAILVVQLGFDEYWVRQTSWKGSKSIEVGTGRAMPVAWLTSLDDPVQVLQLTGALVTPAGKVLRVGAEGLLARRTGMTASVLGAQEILTEADLETLREPEADGSPRWRAALRDLVKGLLAEPGR